MWFFFCERVTVRIVECSFMLRGPTPTPPPTPNKKTYNKPKQNKTKQKIKKERNNIPTHKEKSNKTNETDTNTTTQKKDRFFMVDSMSYFSFQQVLHDWCNKRCGK